MSIVEMRVHMDCPGCETRIKKALSKIKGVDNIYVDMEMQKVTVMGWADQKKVLKTVRNTGRVAEIWPYPYNPEYHGYAHKYYFSNNSHDSQAPTKKFYSGYRGGGLQHSIESKPSSIYNYHVHGYNGHEHGYFQQPLSSAFVDEGTRYMFSDENVHGCSIM
ncbi:heavy metal-associated isoprenylated plant protein 29-like [Primulina huaijiensis]|uniref:heavy metal-associated isoprenylated plant protein 29-like n=1 Tax=Primulina huaijiensis TaxID=1492673 RepID=UPI003CC791DF